MRYPIVFATLVTGLVLVTLNGSDNRILRGSKSASQALQSELGTVRPDTVISENTGPDAVTRNADSSDAGQTPIHLNLKLPDIDWEDEVYGNPETFPNVFGKSRRESVLNWSGRLHIDESEEAKAKPLNETILGAEVELQLKLP